MMVSLQTTHTIDDTLDERGILGAARAAGWVAHPSGSGFRVPVYNLAGTPSGWSAVYNVAAAARQRFGKVSLSGKPEGIRYYLLPGLQREIAAADGQCYLASGLTDLLSFHAAGLPNVIAPLGGENAIPESFADDLRELGVRKLIYLPDKDPTGERSAQKITARLTGINLQICEIPGPAKDINDLWAGFISLGHAAAPAFPATVGLLLRVPFCLS